MYYMFTNLGVASRSHILFRSYCNLMVSACRGPAMDYMSTYFGADSSSYCPFRVQTDKQTDRRD